MNHDYIIPPIGTKGFFKFKPPYNKKEDIESYQYTVTSVNDIKELINQGVDVYYTMYQFHTMEERDFEEDRDNGVPVLGLATDDNNYLYVPADRILVSPNIVGSKYQRIILAATLGYTPLSIPLTLLENNVTEIVTNMLGVEPTVSAVNNSTTKLIDNDKHDEYMTVLKRNRLSTMSYRQLYNVVKEELLVKKKYNQDMEKFLIYTLRRLREAETDGETKDQVQARKDNLALEVSQLTAKEEELTRLIEESKRS